MLWLSPHLPWPLNNGSKIRLYHLLQHTRRWADVDLAVPFSPDDAAHAATVRQWVNELLFEDFPVRPVASALPGKLWSGPPEFGLFHQTGLPGEISRRLSADVYDLVECHHSLCAPALPRLGPAPVVVHFVDWRWRVHGREAVTGLKGRLRRALFTRRARKIEEAIARSAQGCVFMSEEDAALAPAGVACGDPQNAVVVANGVDLTAFPFEEKPGEGLLFMGTLNYAPNTEALDWWCHEIRPLVNSPLVVVGSKPPPGLREKLSLNGVTLFADVPEVKPFLQSCRLLVAPLRSGGGTRLKILPACAAGRVVVRTRGGAEGLGARHGEHLWLADTPQDFAEGITQLNRDDALYARLRQGARALVVERFGWEKITQVHERFVKRLLV